MEEHLTTNSSNQPENDCRLNCFNEVDEEEWTDPRKHGSSADSRQDKRSAARSETSPPCWRSAGRGGSCGCCRRTRPHLQERGEEKGEKEEVMVRQQLRSPACTSVCKTENYSRGQWVIVKRKWQQQQQRVINEVSLLCRSSRHTRELRLSLCLL